MTHREAAEALDHAQLSRRQDLRHEAFADDGGRGAAEVAEWERIGQLLAQVGGVYDPARDAAAQDEQRAQAAYDAADKAARQQWKNTARRADELERLAREGALQETVPQIGDEVARNLLAHHGSWRAREVDAWLAHALAARRGHYAEPAMRAAADGALPAALMAHAALLSALALAGTADDDQLPFVGRLAQADPGATAQLAAFLSRALAADPIHTDGGRRDPLAGHG
ncbi:hypothetical protein [Streptomyces sp. H39-S7]|uniref:hypothetical protein n=1 Tax=Streptomyces sp. H39-S7 TaxID=3004357 RepID=UPI0022AEA44A|nr:hypothetical protein [Streptomyces sp. H39-S7]MCZ4120354.1 hypothetical protein [Streptomyces sp. H39-S7]